MDMWTQLGRFATFETERLVLRPFRFSDREDFFEIAGHSENLAFIFPCTASQAESDFLLVHSFMKAPLGVWAIEDKVSQKMIGAIRFEQLAVQDKTGEIGYFVNKTFWKKGIATEALKNLVFLAFQEIGLDLLKIVVHQENKASERVAQKAGFSLFRQFKGSDRYTHQMRHYLVYHYQREDWSNE